MKNLLSSFCAPASERELKIENDELRKERKGKHDMLCWTKFPVVNFIIITLYLWTYFANSSLPLPKKFEFAFCFQL